MMNNDKFIPQGWECPKCGAVMSPTTNVCVNCNGQTQVSVNVSSSSISDQWIGISPEVRTKCIMETLRDE